jgi:hypothetical protein
MERRPRCYGQKHEKSARECSVCSLAGTCQECSPKSREHTGIEEAILFFLQNRPAGKTAIISFVKSVENTYTKTVGAAISRLKRAGTIMVRVNRQRKWLYYIRPEEGDENGMRR